MFDRLGIRMFKDVWDFGFRVQGLGFRVSGLGCRVHRHGSRQLTAMCSSTPI